VGGFTSPVTYGPFTRVSRDTNFTFELYLDPPNTYVVERVNESILKQLIKVAEDRAGFSKTDSKDHSLYPTNHHARVTKC